VTDIVRVERGRYHDSVTLMRASAAAGESPGVETVIAAMATDLNRALLAEAGFPEPDATPDDLVIAVRSDGERSADEALATVERVLGERRRPGPDGDGQRAPLTVESAAARDDDAGVVVVSVPGQHAVVEAVAALRAGRHVMVFSDGVDVADEVALKREAASLGRLVMGPDCGTAILGGVGLGFANVVAPGPVGLVAASGTGAQQLCCLLDGAGVGVRHVLGVGGRDLSSDVQGASTLAALEALDGDPEIEVIALVSKPPDPDVADTVMAAARRCRTPVVPAFVGPGRPTLTDAAAEIAASLGMPFAAPRSWWPPADPIAGRPGPVLGLFSGGTNAAEAVVVLEELVGPVRSNVHHDRSRRIGPRDDPRGHAVLDLGDDELTAGRPHPMIDPAAVADRVAAAAGAAGGPGVVLLDVVLGHGAHPDPAAVLTPALGQARAAGVAVVVALVGSDGDPQGLERQADALVAFGATVHRSNARAAEDAAALVTAAERADGGHGDRAAATSPVADLLAAPRAVITVGAPTLDEALAAQGVHTVAVEWRPPPAGSIDAVAAVSAEPGLARANGTAVERMASVRPHLVDVGAAGELVGIGRHQLLHAGPPLDWGSASGPMRGAVIGACLYEGWADTPEVAEALAASGSVELSPCHDHASVGPMAGIVSPSMPMWVLEDGDGRTSRSTLNEGLGKVLRYGAFGDAVTERLRWMEHVLGPVLAAALRRHGPVDVGSLIASMVAMGDEGHNRNRAGTSLLVRALAPDLARSIGDGRGGLPAGDVADVLAFVDSNDHFLLNVVMAAGKLVADAGRGVPGSSVVVAMARNGTEFGIRTAGTGDRWFTAPASVPDGLYLGAFGPDDANADIGDSTITETVGLGGFAMAGAPAIVQLVGGEVGDARNATELMYEVTLAEHPTWTLPALGFRGVPFGIDVLRVVRTGVTPIVNTGIAGRVAGTGQVGAGLVRPPLDCFTAALAALAAGGDADPGGGVPAAAPPEPAAGGAPSAAPASRLATGGGAGPDTQGWP
jgi:succinyl-CoA synthetase alpha subunit